MELIVARSIINTAIEGGYDVEMPERNSDIKELAKSLYVHARKENNQDVYMKEIIALGDGAAEAEVEQIIPENKVLKKLADQGFSIPSDLKGEVIDMPKDITTIDDMKLRRLLSVFGAYLSRAKLLTATAQSDLASATHLRDDAYRKSLAKVDRVDSDTGKSKLKEIMDIEARQDKEFQKWESLVREHTDNLGMLKALAEIYGSNCDRISREATMRHHEWERSK